MSYEPVLSRFAMVRPGSRANLWSAKCPCPAHQHGDRRPSARLWVDEETGALKWWCAKGCTWREVVAVTGTDPRDWFPPRVADRPPGRRARKADKMANIVAAFDYTDERGQLLYQVLRTEPKGFCQRRPIPGREPGNWAYTLSAGTFTYSSSDKHWVPITKSPAPAGAVELTEVRRVPYRLPELLDEKRKAHPVLVCEGEGKADLLRGLGFIATCNAGGAGKWSVMFGGWLTGRRVVVFPDRDDVGFAHGCQVAASCIAFGAESVRFIRYGMGWEKMPEKSDVKDWLAGLPKPPADRGDTPYDLRAFQRAQLIYLIKMQPEWKPTGGVS